MVAPDLTMQDNLVKAFGDLFNGNQTAYGTETGGCVRGVPAWWALMLGHLTSLPTVGVYPMCHIPASAAWMVKWGCVDFDVKSDDKPAGDYESEAHAADACHTLRDVLLHAYEIPSFPEVTRSRGRHLWVFGETWVQASTMRRALLVASEIAGTSVREVNPKQESLPEGALGNYVRLPYPSGLQTKADEYTRRAIYLPGGQVLQVKEFVALALANLVSPESLGAAAAAYVPPPPPMRLAEDFDAPVCDRSLTRQLSPLAWTVFREGPLPGHDRSGTLYRLAHLCKDDGMAPQEALAIVTAADEAWGKFHARADGSRRLRDIIGSIYREDWEDQ